MSVFTILQRNVKWRFHNSFTIIVTILQPILWLMLYSAVASQTMQGTGISNYTGFILPGLIILVSFSACSSGGIMNYMMKADGSLPHFDCSYPPIFHCFGTAFRSSAMHIP